MNTYMWTCMMVGQWFYSEGLYSLLATGRKDLPSGWWSKSLGLAKLIKNMKVCISFQYGLLNPKPVQQKLCLFLSLFFNISWMIHPYKSAAEKFLLCSQPHRATFVFFPDGRV